MEQLLLTLVFGVTGYLIGYTFRRPSNEYVENIGPPKSINVNKTRYFFVGWSIGKKADGNLEWIARDGNVPQKKELYTFLKKEGSLPQFEYNELVIQGLYEFKNKAECDLFFNGQKQ